MRSPTPSAVSESSLRSESRRSAVAVKLHVMGRIFFGTSTVAFGIFQLVRADFVRLVPPLPAWMSNEAFWAQAIGAISLVIGTLILTGKYARLAATTLAIMILLSVVFLHIPQIAADPLRGFKWTNPCKALALFGGALLLAHAPVRSIARPAAPTVVTARALSFAPIFFFGLFLLICGIQHFVYAGFVTQLVPAWLPARSFWTYFTGLALMAGGLGVFIPATARWAAGLSSLMILLWVFLLHLPRAFADLSETGEMDGAFEALAVSGIALMLTSQMSRLQGTRFSRP